jgi:hypothetical protein
MAAVPSKGPAKKGASPSRPSKKTVNHGREVAKPTSTSKGTTKATKKPGKGDLLAEVTKRVR